MNPFDLIFCIGGNTLDMISIVDLFSNLAVPVACLVAMFYLWDKERTDHKEEMERITQALENNTIVMTQIRDRLKME